MSLEVGIVGLPNVGKSTLFQAITAAPAEAANYPFCTIEPNVGMVEVPDERLDRLEELIHPQKVIKNIVKMVDIAGLVKGASKGEGLGNQFLDHIRQVDAIAHIVRCFEDDNIVHVDGKVSPSNDVDVIKTELVLADLGQVEKKLERTKKNLKGDKSLVKQIDYLEKVKAHLDQGLLAKNLELSTEDEEKFQKELNLITAKPFFYVMNVSEDDLEQETDLQREVLAIAEKDQVQTIKLCCKLEAELASMEKEEKEEFLSELGISKSGLDQVIQEGYRLLNQLTFFTAGVKEVRAWNTRSGSSAPEAAGKIHSDMQRGFIRAEVFHYDDIDQYHSEAAVKDAGKLRVEGKDYIVQNGDIMHFRFNV